MGLISPQKIATIASTLIVSILGASTLLMAQTTTEQSKSPKPTISESPSEAPKKSAEPTKKLNMSDKEMAELDGLLLGPWVFLTDDAKNNPSIALVKAAVSRCATPVKIKKLDIESGAKKELPEATEMLGDLIYYRTSKGLQRFDVTMEQLTLLLDAKKFDKKTGQIVWAIIGKTSGHTLRFANMAKRGGKAQLMLEDSKLYLRCKFNDPKKPATEN